MRLHSIRRQHFSGKKFPRSLKPSVPSWLALAPKTPLNFEIQESFFCERVETICEKKRVKLDPKMLMGWNLRGHGEGIERLVDELLATLRKKMFVLIIFDPIYKALGNRDENKAGDVASMLNELEKIAVLTGAAIAFGAHYSKGNQSSKESIDRIGGSGVFARDPDSILTMTAHEKEDAFTVDATLRNFKPLAPFVVRWEWPLFSRDESLDPFALKKPKGSGQFGAARSRQTPQDLLNLLPMRESLPKNTLLSIAQRAPDDKRIGLNRARNFLSELISSGQVIEEQVPRPGTNPSIHVRRASQELI